MNDIDLSMRDVDESKCFTLIDGENVVNSLQLNYQTGVFEQIEMKTVIEGDSYLFVGLWCTVYNRYGVPRLYVVGKTLEGGDMYLGFVVRRNDGTYLLASEFDEKMNSELSKLYLGSNEVPKKKSVGKIIFSILLFPFFLLWQFIKALLSLGKIMVKDDEFFRGLTGNTEKPTGYEGYDEYTFTNSAGCSKTVYSNNSRDFYYSDGSYAGASHDNGKTIEWR